MKKTLIFVICVSMVFGLTGCGLEFEPRPTSSAISSQQVVSVAPPSSSSGDAAPPDDPAGEKKPEVIEHIKNPVVFELPVAGASGYAGIGLPLYVAASESADAIGTLRAGQGFTILEDDGNWWYIKANNVEGWVNAELCFINLPDIIPSIVCDNTNTYSSLFRSSGINIPDVTGRALYQARDFNERLGREEYIAPVLYGMAPKIYAAQQAAVADGHTLIIYEAFRPHDAHQLVYENLSALAEENKIVEEGLTNMLFTAQWFLAPSPYNHQRGTAIDVSLGRIDRRETRATGDYEYTQITEYTEYTMQTTIHELSTLSAIYHVPVPARIESAWRDAVIADWVTPGSRLLQWLCTNAGLTPLASEWWHFNDIPSTELATDAGIVGRYSLDKSYSVPPRRP